MTFCGDFQTISTDLGMGSENLSFAWILIQAMDCWPVLIFHFYLHLSHTFFIFLHQQLPATQIETSHSHTPALWCVFVTASETFFTLSMKSKEVKLDLKLMSSIWFISKKLRSTMGGYGLCGLTIIKDDSLNVHRQGDFQIFAHIENFEYFWFEQITIS